GIGIFSAVVPRENSAMRDSGYRMTLVEKEMAEVGRMAHPLIGNSTGKLFVQPVFKVKLRIVRTVGLVHQPRAPIGILFANLLDLWAAAPARPVIIPCNLILGHVAQYSLANQFPHSNAVRLAAMLRADL